MPTTAINMAMTAQSQAAAAQAQQAADDAHRERCKIELASFKPQGASTVQMQSYASCVNFVYPKPSTPGEEVATTILVALLLLGFFIGAVVGFIRAYDDKIISAVFGGFFGTCLAALGLLLFCGVAFVIS